MSNFSCHPILHLKVLQIFQFDVDVVDSDQVSLHLFCDQGQEKLKYFRICLHAVPFEPVNSNFSHTY